MFHCLLKVFKMFFSYMCYSPTLISYIFIELIRNTYCTFTHYNAFVMHYIKIYLIDIQCVVIAFIGIAPKMTSSFCVNITLAC